MSIFGSVFARGPCLRIKRAVTGLALRRCDLSPVYARGPCLRKKGPVLLTGPGQKITCEFFLPGPLRSPHSAQARYPPSGGKRSFNAWIIPARRRGGPACTNSGLFPV
jgi:hypothetical protein